MTTIAASRVRDVLEPALQRAGFDLEDVAIRRAGRRQLVQVVVDKDGGITLDDVADASRACSGVLDEADLIQGEWVLEVTSPGTDRPLTAPRHWRRATGRLVAVRRRETGELTGRVVVAGETGATLRVGDAEVDVRYDDVVRATVQIEFHRTAGEPDDPEDPDDEGGDAQ